MNQVQLIILLLRIGLISGVAAITAWIAVYSRLAYWWRNSVGRTMVIEAVLVAVLFVPQLLSLFSRIDPLVVEWTDVALIGLMTPAFAWRTVVFLRMGPSPERKHARPAAPGTEPPGAQDLDG